MNKVIKEHSFFVKYYIVLVILTMYLTTLLSHLLTIHIASFLQYIPMVLSVLSMVAIVAIYTKKREAKTLLKKVLNYVVAVFVAILIIQVSSSLAKKSIIGIQTNYSEKFSKEWDIKVNNEAFLNEIQEYMNNDSEDIMSASENRAVELIFMYQEEVFFPVFNNRNKLLYIFMIPNDFK